MHSRCFAMVLPSNILQSKRKKRKFEDYLKIDFPDWMTIRILHCYLLPFYSNVSSVRRSA